MSVMSGWLIVLFKSFISLLIFCLVPLFIIENVVLNCPIFIIEICISPFNFVIFFTRCIWGYDVWYSCFDIPYFSVELTILSFFGLNVYFLLILIWSFELSYDYCLPGTAFPILSL